MTLELSVLLPTGLPVPAVTVSAAVSNECYGIKHENDNDEIIAYVCKIL